MPPSHPHSKPTCLACQAGPSSQQLRFRREPEIQASWQRSIGLCLLLEKGWANKAVMRALRGIIVKAAQLLQNMSSTMRPLDCPV